MGLACRRAAAALPAWSRQPSLWASVCPTPGTPPTYANPDPAPGLSPARAHVIAAGWRVGRMAGRITGPGRPADGGWIGLARRQHLGDLGGRGRRVVGVVQHLAPG